MAGLRYQFPLRFSGICSIVSGSLLTFLGAANVVEPLLGGQSIGLRPWITLVAGILFAATGVAVVVLVARIRDSQSGNEPRG